MEVLYLNNINDLLSGFCIQTDTTRIMQASGNKYTDIKLQGLIPSYKTFLTDKYSMAACTDDSVSTILLTCYDFLNIFASDSLRSNV